MDNSYALPLLSNFLTGGQDDQRRQQQGQAGGVNPLIALLSGFGPAVPGMNRYTPVAGMNAARGLSPGHMAVSQQGQLYNPGQGTTPTLRTSAIGGGEGYGGY